MIFLRLQDGMGNQMFMYTFARYIQKITNEKIYISQYDLVYNPGKRTKRSYALGHFQLNKNVILLNGLVDYCFNKVYFFIKLIFEYYFCKGRMDEISDYELLGVKVYCSENGFKYSKIKNVSRGIKIVDGYFFTWKYAKEIRDKIKWEFQIAEPPTGLNKEILCEIRKENSVCVHIRRGDFLSVKEKGKRYVCKPEYFYEAMDIMKAKIENPVFYIFSDNREEIENIKKMYTFKYPVIYLDNNNPDYEDIRLMMSCKHFIISNSTFSWWAQYLGSDKNKIVVAPSQKNRDSYDNLQYYYEDGWILVDV